MLKHLTCALALMAAPVFADTVTVETYTGPAEVPANPETIAVFDIAALDTLDALGVKPAGTIGNAYVDYLSTEGTETVGSLFEPDYEALAALNPDLIIAGGRSAKVVPELAKLAPTIDMTIWEDTLGQSLDRLDAYGEIFDKQDEAAALKEKVESKLAAAKDAASTAGSALIVMTNGPKVSAYGSGGRFGWLHSAVGLPEAVEAVEQTTHGEAVSFEFIRDANPDVLIVIDRLAATGQEGASAQSTLDNALVQDTNAWKNDKVLYLDAARLYIAGGGIQALMYTLDELIAGLK
ncbi:siderophore ABC transporter substrate-binding protein [Celeribacter sp.]|uniref:siderophore ABC transporter substrate-binding protein n=1 Tax=Celeribacter sp. TaxID=1890673 RepID=UPI003A8CFF12